MARTMTSYLTYFTRPLPSAVKYDLSSPEHVQITLPARSLWSSGLHWHETHTEYLQVLQGAIYVQLGTRMHILGPDDGVVVVEKRMRHCWGRADSITKFAANRKAERSKNEAVVVLESTDPADGQKEIFFRNLNSVILEQRSPSIPMFLHNFWTEYQLWLIFAALDNYPVVVNLRRSKHSTWLQQTEQEIERLVTYTLFAIVALIGKLFRILAAKREYTPEPLLAEWAGIASEKSR